MSNPETFAALVAGILSILGALGAALRLLLRISWNTARMVQRFDEHVRTDDAIHADIEARMRLLERRRR